MVLSIGWQAFPSIEKLGLTGKDNANAMVHRGQFLGHLRRKLKSLVLGHDDKSEVLSVDILCKFQNLEMLKLLGCSYKEIFYAEAGEFKGMYAQLKILDLRSLHDLEFVCEQDSKLNAILQKLEVLEVFDCPNLVRVTTFPLSFGNLTTLRIWKCDRLINLLTSSTAKSLVQLIEMKINSCRRMTEVVSDDESTIEEEIIFPKLKNLLLHDLSSLTNFCSGDYMIKFPLLEELSMDKCPNLKFSSDRVLFFRKLRIRLGQKWIRGSFVDDINTAFQKLHKETVRSFNSSINVF